MKSLQAYRSILWHAILNRLPIPVRRVIAALAVLIEEPEPEALPTKSRQLALLHLQTTTWGWLPALALTGALGVLSLAHAYTSARSGAAGAEFFFWAGLLLIFVPSSIRLLSPAPSRFERITLLCIMGIYFCLTPVLSSPFSFSSYDEFLHWRTADDILRTRHLFKTNTMLVASPFYPGLEIVTNALSTLSGLNTFAAGHIVLGIVRLVMMLSLFMLYERITESARIASIATLIYMTNPHFLTFDAMFSYESIALPLAMFAVFAIARHDKPTRENRWMVPVAWIALAAVAVTHHMTDFVFDGLLVLWTLIYAWQHRHARGTVLRSKLVWTTCFGVVVTIITVSLIGDPVTRYLSTYFSHALDDLGHVLTGAGGARQLFAATAGQATPLWERLLTVVSVLLILAGLPFGLLCLWRRYRTNALAGMLGIFALAYPVSHVFRFTNAGSEISDRSAAFLFIAVSCILAVLIAQFWPVRRLSWRWMTLLTGALAVIFMGGTILGAGPPWEVLPGPYMVAADERSIEPQGIQAALWTRAHLGPDNPTATDRVNSLLMSTYGDQKMIISLTGETVPDIFLSPTLDAGEIAALRQAHVRYLVVDRRLAKALPAVGFYFELGEPGSDQRTRPADLAALTKFNTIPQISRVFDSGDIIIYDIGGLTGAP